MLATLALLALWAAEPPASVSPCGAIREAEVHFSIDMRISGRKFFIPFSGFFHSEADLVMDASPQEGGVQLSLRKPLRPPYTLQSLGRTGTEMQARVMATSDEEGLSAGSAALAQYVRQQPELEKTIAPERRKPVSFVYEAPPAGKFQFVVGRDGRLARTGLRNDVKAKAARATETYPFVYEALARALGLLASPSIDVPAGVTSFSLQSPEAQAAVILGQVCGTLVPRLKGDVALVQKEPFAVAVTGPRAADGTVTLEGKASPQLPLKDDLLLTSFTFTRRLCADGTPLATAVEMQVRGQQDNGGRVSLSVVFK